MRRTGSSEVAWAAPHRPPNCMPAPCRGDSLPSLLADIEYVVLFVCVIPLCLEERHNLCPGDSNRHCSLLYGLAQLLAINERAHIGRSALPSFESPMSVSANHLGSSSSLESSTSDIVIRMERVLSSLGFEDWRCYGLKVDRSTLRVLIMVEAST